VGNADNWIVHLNTPDPADPNKSIFVPYTVSTTPMRLALESSGIDLDPVAFQRRIPLAKRTTVQDTVFVHCWEWTAFGWVESADCGTSHQPRTAINTGVAVKPQKTITEWELRDINGDGYPDFIYNASSVTTVDHFKMPPTPGRFIGQIVQTHEAADLAASRDVKALINMTGVHLADGALLFTSPIRTGVASPVGKQTRSDSPAGV